MRWLPRLILVVVVVSLGPLSAMQPARAFSPALGLATVANPAFLATAAILVAGGLAVDYILNEDDSVVANVAEWFESPEFASSSTRALVQYIMSHGGLLLLTFGAATSDLLRDETQVLFDGLLPPGWEAVDYNGETFYWGSVPSGSVVMRGTFGPKPQMYANPELFYPEYLSFRGYSPWNSCTVGNFMVRTSVGDTAQKAAQRWFSPTTFFPTSNFNQSGLGPSSTWELVYTGGGNCALNACFSNVATMMWRYDNSVYMGSTTVYGELVGVPQVDFDRWHTNASLEGKGIGFPVNLEALRSQTQADIAIGAGALVRDGTGRTVVNSDEILTGVANPAIDDTSWEDAGEVLDALNVLGRIWTGIRDWIQSIGRTLTNVATDIRGVVVNIADLPTAIWTAATTWVYAMFIPSVSFLDRVDFLYPYFEHRFPIGLWVSVSDALGSVFAGDDDCLRLTLPAGAFGDYDIEVCPIAVVSSWTIPISRVGMGLFLVAYLWHLLRRFLATGDG